jgi:hypothetical protein
LLNFDLFVSHPVTTNRSANWPAGQVSTEYLMFQSCWSRGMAWSGFRQSLAVLAVSRLRCTSSGHRFSCNYIITVGRTRCPSCLVFTRSFPHEHAGTPSLT